MGVNTKEYMREYRANNPEKTRYTEAKNKLKKYGLTPEQYDEMLAEQGGKCALCYVDTPGGRGRFHVDHDHATGVVRALLCSSCNLLLGQAGDISDRLHQAAVYLEKHGR